MGQTTEKFRPSQKSLRAVARAQQPLDDTARLVLLDAMLQSLMETEKDFNRPFQDSRAGIELRGLFDLLHDVRGNIFLHLGKSEAGQDDTKKLFSHLQMVFEEASWSFARDKENDSYKAFRIPGNIAQAALDFNAATTQAKTEGGKAYAGVKPFYHQDPFTALNVANEVLLYAGVRADDNYTGLLRWTWDGETISNIEDYCNRNRRLFTQQRSMSNVAAPLVNYACERLGEIALGMDRLMDRVEEFQTGGKSDIEQMTNDHDIIALAALRVYLKPYIPRTAEQPVPQDWTPDNLSHMAQFKQWHQNPSP